MKLPKRVRRAAGIALVPLSLLPFAATVPAVVRQERTPAGAADRSAHPYPGRGVVPAAVARRRWPAFAPAADAVPVLAYHGISERRDRYSVSRASFARQMTMLDRAGFESISPRQYVRWRRGDRRGLPARPILITFDDSRLDSLRGADAVLERHGFRATMYVITGSVDEGRPFHLRWGELRAMQRSGRWDLQEHSDDGHREITVDAAGRRGPFFANREWRDGRLESLDAFTVRVSADLAEGRRRLTEEVPGFEPATFAAPYGNFGQNATNDRRIASVMRGLLGVHYSATFTQNRPAYTSRSAPSTDLQRYEVHSGTSADAMYAWLRDHRPEAVR